MADVSKLRKRRILPGPPPTEASPNLDQPEVAPSSPSLEPPRSQASAEATPGGEHRRLDGRSMRRTNRTVQFATRVTPEFDRRVRALAQRGGLLLVEVLERALDAFEGHHSSSRMKAAR